MPRSGRGFSGHVLLVLSRCMMPHPVWLTPDMVHGADAVGGNTRWVPNVWLPFMVPATAGVSVWQPVHTMLMA